jgi:hypothetical protein
VNFRETAAMSFFTRETCRDEGADDVEREFHPNYARAKNEHVAVVVFA